MGFARLKLPGVFALALLLFVVANVALFGAPVYRSLLDPASSAGSFEAARQALTDFAADSHTDVLVVGDSRIYAGLDPSVASAAARQRLRFINAGVPGTNPRCWYYFLQAIDPSAHRFRALVIPVDDYADTNSAIGSIDGDQRQQDLHYLALTVEPQQIPKLAGSFAGVRMQFPTGIDLLLRGPILRDDIQAFLADPRARFEALAQEREHPPFEPLAAHPRTETLSGLRADLMRNRIAYPPGVSPDEQSAIALQVLQPEQPSPSYATYRREWLYPIVERYARAGVPVIFVRIPTRPVHRSATDVLGRSLQALKRSGLARFVPNADYLALEQPALFADHDHLNQPGSRRFSELLGRDVARMLGTWSPSTDPRSVFSPAGFSRPSVGEVVGIGIPMQFQSYEFWIFVTVVALVFYALPLRVRPLLLLAASYYFYARWNGWYVVFLLALTVSDFLIALAIERTAGRARRALLIGGIAANLAFLGTFKYANFATGTITALLAMHSDPWLVRWIVPIGISFHTFQSISYLVDVDRAKTPAIRDPWSYALYLAFFPQLLSGPIVRAGLFFGELLHWKKPTIDDVGYASVRIAFGLFKKVVIADRFGPIVDAFFSAVPSHPGALAAWSAIVSFSLQIYFDFSAYSDIAIGIARLFGFVFPENFNLPYLARSVTEFWHCWHMTLSTWLRDYLYIPLGGSRGGWFATMRNLMITMLLGGLWHGSQWTFVAWGGLHGLFLAFERATGIGQRPSSNNRFVHFLRAVATFGMVTLAWVLFRAQTFGQAVAVYHQLFAGGSGASMIEGWSLLLLICIAGFAFARIFSGTRLWNWSGVPRYGQACTVAVLLLAVEVLSYPGTPATFIYFKF